MAQHLHNPNGCRDKEPPGRVRRVGSPACIAAILLLLLAGGFTSSASDVGGIILPDYHHIDITLAHNGGTNYIKFDGGGINALHLTTSTSEPYGQVTTTEEESGTFYVSDTGGRGFFDDLILMIAVKGDVPDDYSVHIRSSGYRWTPTPILNMPPTMENITYADGSIDETFRKSDFIYGPQSWRPYNGPDFPFYCGQDKASGETFRFLFADLKVGALGPNSDLDDLIDDGMAKIEYELDGDTAFTVFNVYGWNNQSNQGKGISWTNDVSGSSDSGMSGYSVLASGGSSAGGDQPSSADTSATGETGGGGFEGATLAQGEPVIVNGSVGIFMTEGTSATLEDQRSAWFSLNATLAPGGSLQEGFLYLYGTGGRDTSSGKGVLPTLDTSLDGVSLTLLQTYKDTMGGSDGTISATYVYRLPATMIPGPHNLLVKNRNPGTKITVAGGVALLFWKDDSGKVTAVSFTEGCDIVRAEPGRPEDEATTTSLFRDRALPGRPDRAAAYLVSTGTTPVSPPPLRFFFNLEAVNGTSPDTDRPVEVRSFDVSGLARPSGNTLSVAVVPVEEKVKSLTETRNAILVFTYESGTQAAIPSPVPTERPPQAQATVPAGTPTASPTAARSVIPTQEPVTGPGETNSMFPGPIGDFFSGIFAMLFAIGGVPDQAPAGNPPASAPTVAATPDGGTSAEAAGQGSPVPTVPEQAPQESPDDDAWVQDSTATGDAGDEEWISGTTAASSPYGGIYINSIPGGAGITIDGKSLSTETPKTIFGLREGSHTVRISNEKKLYSITDQQVWIYRGILSSVTFDTTPGMKKPVEIKSGPYSGDPFTLNGKYPAYRIPAGITLKKAGSYITILHEGSFLSNEISDYLNPMDVVEIRSSPTAFGRIQVRSDPAGADVLVDGFPSGQKTPCIVENLSEGRHTLALSMLGYLPFEKEFMVLDDPRSEIDDDATFTLTPYAYGELTVESTPPGATVLIDKMNFRKTTPCTFPYMTIGSYSMKVTSGDKSRNVEFEIKPRTGNKFEFDFGHDTFLQREYGI